MTEKFIAGFSRTKVVSRKSLFLSYQLRDLINLNSRYKAGNSLRISNRSVLPCSRLQLVLISPVKSKFTFFIAYILFITFKFCAVISINGTAF